MECKHEPRESKFGEPCAKGYMFCMEDKCPDYEPRFGQLKEDA